MNHHLKWLFFTAACACRNAAKTRQLRISLDPKILYEQGHGVVETRVQEKKCASKTSPAICTDNLASQPNRHIWISSRRWRYGTCTKCTPLPRSEGECIRCYERWVRVQDQCCSIRGRSAYCHIIPQVRPHNSSLISGAGLDEPSGDKIALGQQISQYGAECSADVGLLL